MTILKLVDVHVTITYISIPIYDVSGSKNQNKNRRDQLERGEEEMSTAADLWEQYNYYFELKVYYHLTVHYYIADT